MEQFRTYTPGMLKLLETQSTPNEPVEIVLLLGKKPAEWANLGGRERAEQVLRTYKARIVFYDQLLKDAYSAYADYMEKRKMADRLAEVMRAIDDYAPPDEVEATDRDEAVA